MNTKAWVALAAAIIVVACIYAFVAIPNYQECRESGHSRMYCAATHLVR